MVSTAQPTLQEFGQARSSSLVLNSEQDWKQTAQTPNSYFTSKFPQAAKIYGSPFLELETTDAEQFTITNPISINHDFFASCLGGKQELGHKVVWFLPGLQFYFYDPADQCFKVTSQEKLQLLVRSWLIRCAEELSKTVNILNLFQEFRSDSTTKQIVNRAKTILAADEGFFAVESKNVRKEGPELPERLARVFVESMLERKEGAILTVTQAYALFSQLSQQRNLNPIPRSPFREMMVGLMKDMFGVSIRRDLPNQENKQQEGWKGVGTSAHL